MHLLQSVCCNYYSHRFDKSGRMDDAHEVVEEALALGVRLDAVSYCILMACSARAGEGEVTVAYMREAYLERGLTLSPGALNGVLCSLAHHGLAPAALTVLELMGAHGLAAGEVAYHATIGACCRAAAYPELLTVFKSMREAGLRPDEVAFSMAIKACEHSSGGWRLAVRILRDAERCGMATTSLYFRALTLLAHSGKASVAAELFEECQGLRQPCQGCCDALVTAHYRAGDVSGAVEWVQRLQAASLPLGPVAYTSAITACRSLGDWRGALGLYEGRSPEAKVAESAPLFNSLISVLGSGAAPSELVERVLRDMEESSVQWDTGTYTALMAYHSQARSFSSVVDLWDKLLADGSKENGAVRPTAANSWLAVHACSMVGDGPRAEAVVSLMRRTDASTEERGAPSWGDFYIAALEACKPADAERALRLLGDMGGVTAHPPVGCYSRVILICERAGAWRGATQALVHMMESGHQPSTAVFNSALGACICCGEYDMAMRVFRFMRASGVTFDDTAFGPELLAWIRTQPGGDAATAAVVEQDPSRPGRPTDTKKSPMGQRGDG